MSLINCPECGKENVSDSAESCPNCGYNIKAHVTRENIRINEEKRRKEQEEKQKELEEKNLQENKRKINSIYIERNRKIQEIKDSALPAKPSFLKTSFQGNVFTWLLIGFSVFQVLLFLLSDSDFFISLLVVVLLIGIPVLSWFNWEMYKDDLNKYNKIASDFEHYKREKIKAVENEYDRKINNIRQYGSEDEPSRTNSYRQTVNTPKCPTCGSTNIKKIGTVNRAASVYAAGLASSKMGKQFECKNCGYKW